MAEHPDSVLHTEKLMMRAAQFTAGGPELLTIGQVPEPELRERDVLVEVHATAINRADTLQRKGVYPPPPGESDVLGLEAAGVVKKLGSGATKWKLGDRVMALLGGGGNAELVRVHEDHVMPIPTTLTFIEAAAIPEVWITAYQLLFFIGKLKAGETVLVHAGGSGVGTAATQLAKQAGGRVLVTAGSQMKIDSAKAVGAEEGFNYKEKDFAEEVLKYTGGHGVDVVLDCVGASYWEKNVKVLTVDGRWVLYGAMGGVHVDGSILGAILRKRIHLMGSTLRTRSTEYKAKLISEFTELSLPHFSDGVFKTVVDSVLPLDELSDAHRRMESNLNSGKIIIQVIPDSQPHAEL